MPVTEQCLKKTVAAGMFFAQRRRLEDKGLDITCCRTGMGVLWEHGNGA